MKRKMQEKEREVQKIQGDTQKYGKQIESYKKKIEERDAIVAEKTKELAGVRATMEENENNYRAKVIYFDV